MIKLMQTVQINGVAWQQSQYICHPADGGTVEQIGILTSTSLYNNKHYSIDYKSDSGRFNMFYAHTFQPMITSFRLQ